MKRLITVWLTLALTGPVFAGDVIVSEIMYNPDSAEGRGSEANPTLTEWVELYNTGDSEVNLTGYTLADEDGQTGPIADGTTLAPGEALVLVPVECGVDNFRAAWGDGFQVVPITGWGTDGLHQLANEPSDTNEILSLLDADGAVVDEVNYDDEGDWPADGAGGRSIYVNAEALNSDANDQGANWSRSEDGDAGVRQNNTTDVFDGSDFGSPGSVAVSQSGAAEESE